MLIEKIKISELKPAKYNPRKDLKPEDEEYQKIKKSILEFGYVEPIIVNVDMTVIGGHQRLKVLKDLDYTEVECVVVDLDKNQEKALNIALNKISGKWDYDKLEDVINELANIDYDLSNTGLSDEEIEDLINDLDVKDEDFLKDTEIVRNREPKEIICPNCGCKIQ